MCVVYQIVKKERRIEREYTSGMMITVEEDAKRES